MFIVVLLALIFAGVSQALAPMEGIVKGDVRDLDQRDPLENLFTDSFLKQETGTKEQRQELELLKGVYDGGLRLHDTCRLKRFYTYRDPWSEQTARRSIAATLQYIGIDLAARAVVEYSKAFKLSDQEFDNIVNNLVVNTCSDNISVYSKKLIRDNLLRMWRTESKFRLPSYEGSPYVAKSNVEKTQSFEAKEKEFNFALKNFRDFCSWDGDVDNYRMLSPYLQNPFVMSIIFRNLSGRKLAWDDEKERVESVEAEDPARVACEDLICRSREKPAFERLFPRMVGSVSLEDDLEVLYCGHFRNTSPKTTDVSPTVKEWINKQTIEEAKISAMNFVSLVTGAPDFFVSADKYKDLSGMYEDTVEHRWDAWAEKETDTLVLDLLYEEALFIDLAERTMEQSVRPDSGLTFDFTLGELDRELNIVDKLSSTFHLEVTESYLAWLRRSYISANNRSDYQEMENIRKKFMTNLDLQLAEKEKYFSTPVWNEDFSRIIAEELIDRLVASSGGVYDELSRESVKIPVKFRFGLFAMKYLRDKYKAKFHHKP